MVDGKWCMVYISWYYFVMVYISWFTSDVYCLRLKVNELRFTFRYMLQNINSIVYGLWCMVRGLWF